MISLIRPIRLFLLAACCLSVGGCTSKTEPPAVPPLASLDPGAIDLQVMGISDIEARIESLHGKVVILDLWASW